MKRKEKKAGERAWEVFYFIKTFGGENMGEPVGQKLKLMGIEKRKKQKQKKTHNSGK